MEMKINKSYLILFVVIGVVLLSGILIRNYLIEQNSKIENFQHDILQQINATQNATYGLILKNQHLIIKLSDTVDQNTQRNLNLTKFNRASLVDSNHILHELAEHLNMTTEEFNSSNIH